MDEKNRIRMGDILERTLTENEKVAIDKLKEILGDQIELNVIFEKAYDGIEAILIIKSAKGKCEIRSDSISYDGDTSIKIDDVLIGEQGQC